MCYYKVTRKVLSLFYKVTQKEEGEGEEEEKMKRKTCNCMQCARSLYVLCLPKRSLFTSAKSVGFVKKGKPLHDDGYMYNTACNNKNQLLSDTTSLMLVANITFDKMIEDKIEMDGN